MNDAYEIVLRAVGPEERLAFRGVKTGGDFSEMMLEWRMSDHHGVLPNDDERHALQAGMRNTFHSRYGVNPYRVSLAIIATTPSRRPATSWKGYRYGIDNDGNPNEGDSNGKEN